MNKKKIQTDYGKLYPLLKSSKTRNQVSKFAKILLSQQGHLHLRRKNRIIVAVPILTITIFSIVFVFYDIGNKYDFAQKTTITNIKEFKIKSSPKPRKPVQEPLLAVLTPTMEVNHQALSAPQVPQTTKRVESLLHHYEDRSIDSLVSVQKIADQVWVESVMPDSVELRIFDKDMNTLFLGFCKSKLVVEPASAAYMYSVDHEGYLVEIGKFTD